LAVGLAEGGRAAGVDAAAAQLFHEGAHGELLGDRVLRVELAARVQGMAALLQHLGRQRNVGRDHQVARLDARHDLRIRDIEAARHLQGADELRTRHAQQLVRDQGHRYLRALGNPVQDVLDDGRAGVGVDPDLHRAVHVGAQRRLIASYPTGRPSG
jgi:hypothetical protein